MNGASHQRPANRSAAGDQLGEITGVVGLEPRPQSEVWRLRLLRLHPDKLLERLLGRQLMPVQKHLASEQRAVELAPAQYLRSGHVLGVIGSGSLELLARRFHGRADVAAVEVIIDKAHRLHERVDGGRPGESPAAALELA